MTAASALRRFGKPKTTRPVVLPAFHPAYRSGRTIFGSRVFDVDEVGRVLKDGHQSRKIGKIIMKGPRRGWPIYTLTLEERATCPRSCKAWAYCYGNSMQAAERIVAGEALEAKLWTELEDLQHRHPGGFLVRLHILGDFYSSEYVGLWRKALDAFSALAVFGYSAHPRGSEIGSALDGLIADFGKRFSLRFSGLDEPLLGSVTLEPGEATPHMICPAQTGGTECCATCGLCWHSTRTVAFLRH